MYLTATRPRSRYRKIILSLGFVASINPLWLEAQELRVGRYTTQQTTPTLEQADLLSAMVKVRFPETVTQVGQAMEYLLESSGYRLVPQAMAEVSRAWLLVLPLPGPHRNLGPVPLRTALETLAGPAYRLVEDPVHRLVTFERCDSIESIAVPIPHKETR
ncbi:MAG: hypothetical protein ABW201_17865 [Candidatus Thiodiazotropha sp.]